MQSTSLQRTLRASLALAGFATLAVTASAASITESFSLALLRTSQTRTVSLAQFNTSLGTLTSIDFSMDGTIQNDMKLANLSMKSTNTITGTVNGSFALSVGTTAYLTGASSISHSGTYAQSADGFTPDYTNNRGQIFPTDTLTKTYTNSTSAAADKALFSGTGNVMISVLTGSTDKSTSTAGNEYLEDNTYGGASGYVRFNYTPVPEPSSMAALALGAIALVRRRKGGRK